MEAVGDWQIGMGNGAISATLTTTTGYNGQALQLSYNLGTTEGAYVQLRRDFDPPLNLSAGDHLRFFHRGTTTNTLEIGLTSLAGDNYFGSGWNEATHVPWWTYATWDFQDFRKDGDPFPDFGQVKAIFISVTKKGHGVGGSGSFLVDNLQFLKVSTRTVASGFEPVTAPPSVTEQAAAWVGAQQQASGLLASWPQEYQQDPTLDFAWSYDQALGLMVLSETNLPRANQLAGKLSDLQNADGSWYAGYHFSTTLPITTTKPVGTNAWIVYALMRNFLKSGNENDHQAALKGAAWLANLQRADGSLPGELIVPPDSGAPTEANLDAWWAFQATGYQTQAASLQSFLLNEVWDQSMGRFKSSGNLYLDRYRIFLDNQTWGAAFLRAVGRDNDARRALSYARWTLGTDSNNDSVCGFDGGGPFSVWNEGTLHYTAAKGENSQYYWDQIAGQQNSDGGLPGSPDGFSGYSVWLTPWRGIAPTAWLYFAGSGGPFDPPTPAFSASPTSGVAPLKVDFTNTSSGIYTQSRWDFGDGSTVTETNPTHMYTWPGQYTVTLEVSGPGGVATATKPAYVAVTSELDLPIILNCHPVPGPVLQPIANGGDGNYLVQWQAPLCPSGTFAYTLQEDDNPNFDSPRSYTASATSFMAKGRVRGSYYYRVKGRYNGAPQDSPWSEVQVAAVDHLTIDNFDDGQDPNAIGDVNEWAGPCVIDSAGGYDPNHAFGGSGFGYALGYGVTPTCYATWQTGLLGQDYSGFSTVTFQIKGASGGERPNIYLQNSSQQRHYVDVEAFLRGGLTTNFRQVRIPLTVYKSKGVDLTRLAYFQIVFEWERSAGRVYVDEIRFE